MHFSEATSTESKWWCHPSVKGSVLHSTSGSGLFPSLSCAIPSHYRRERKAHETKLLQKGELGTLVDRRFNIRLASVYSLPHQQSPCTDIHLRECASHSNTGRAGKARPSPGKETTQQQRPVTDPALLRMPMVTSKGTKYIYSRENTEIILPALARGTRVCYSQIQSCPELHCSWQLRPPICTVT